MWQNIVTQFQIWTPPPKMFKAFSRIRRKYTLLWANSQNPFKNYTSPSNHSSLMLLMLWDPTPGVFPELWLVETASRREQLEAVNLRFRESPLRAESVLLQDPPAPGNTHRLWLFNRPRDGGLFRGDSWWVTRELKEIKHKTFGFKVALSFKRPSKQEVRTGGVNLQHSTHQKWCEAP